MKERWPPVYDADDLARTISRLPATDGSLYVPYAPCSDLCQGDIVRLERDLPVLDEEAEPYVQDGVDHWLVIGNTCDFHRPITEVPWTQLVPVVSLGPIDDVDGSTLTSFRSYQYARRFFLPPWPRGEKRLAYADFLTPVGAHKSGLLAHGEVVARMGFEGWVLLHSCLVRFLRRDDGRFD